MKEEGKEQGGGGRKESINEGRNKGTEEGRKEGTNEGWEKETNEQRKRKEGKGRKGRKEGIHVQRGNGRTGGRKQRKMSRRQGRKDGRGKAIPLSFVSPSPVTLSPVPPFFLGSFLPPLSFLRHTALSQMTVAVVVKEAMMVIGMVVVVVW